MDVKVQRRFVRVGGRRVHYFRAGEGPPAVLVHSSPANARLLMKEIHHLAASHTVFAFDTPGFGLSDPLPGDPLTVADLADALAETLTALAMPRCPMFGTHTGAAIALELGVRHPERVTGLVLDGVPAFTDAECEAYFGTYFRTMPLSELGGHYAEAWTRFRDQSTWFPWTHRTPANLNAYDLSPPHSTHLWVSMFFEAAEHYAPAYRAASYYGEGAIRAAAALVVPAAFCATETDMLYPHLDRLPPLRSDQEIVPIGDSFARKRALIADRFAAYGAEGPAPADRTVIGTTAGIEQAFVGCDGRQLHLRFAGDRAAPAVLLVHDAPGSSEQAEPLIEHLARHFFVVAPDLPGCGESDAATTVSSVDAFAADLAALLARVGLDRALIYGVGFGASTALALAVRRPDIAVGVAVQGLVLPTVAERADLAARYAPPIAIEEDGAHWYRTWLMLRDSQVYWPWYDRRFAAQRRHATDFSARHLHRWTMDVMRGRDHGAGPIAGALAQDAAAALRTLAVPLVQVRGSATPLSAHDDRLATLGVAYRVIEAADDVATRLATAFHDRFA